MFASTKVSIIKCFFICKSKGVSAVKLGVWFTSKSQGLRSPSRIMSKLKTLTLFLPKYFEAHVVVHLFWLT